MPSTFFMFWHTNLIDEMLIDFIVCLILMLHLQPFDKMLHNRIVLFSIRIRQLRIQRIVQNIWIHTSDTIENRFCQIHFPFFIPRLNDTIFILLLSIDGLFRIKIQRHPKPLLVPVENIESLIEFDSLTSPDVCCFILVYHPWILKWILNNV